MKKHYNDSCETILIVTSAEGLITLIEQICTATKRGELGPEFAGKLAKQARREKEALIAAEILTTSQLANIKDALLKLDCVILESKAALLGSAARRLRTRSDPLGEPR